MFLGPKRHCPFWGNWICESSLLPGRRSLVSSPLREPALPHQHDAMLLVIPSADTSTPHALLQLPWLRHSAPLHAPFFKQFLTDSPRTYNEDCDSGGATDGFCGESTILWRGSGAVLLSGGAVRGTRARRSINATRTRMASSHGHHSYIKILMSTVIVAFGGQEYIIYYLDADSFSFSYHSVS